MVPKDSRGATVRCFHVGAPIGGSTINKSVVCVAVELYFLSALWLAASCLRHRCAAMTSTAVAAAAAAAAAVTAAAAAAAADTRTHGGWGGAWMRLNPSGTPTYMVIKNYGQYLWFCQPSVYHSSIVSMNT